MGANIFKRIVFIFLLSRIFMFLTGYLAINLFSSYTVMPEFIETPQPGWVSTNMKLPDYLIETRVPGLDDLSKFDSGYYFGIVQFGYTKAKIHEEHGPANWVFFPLYPLSIYVVKELLSIDMKVASVLLSNLFLLIALFYIYHIALLKGFSEKQAEKVLLFVLIYPSSIFYSLPYTESLFLLLSSATIFYCLNKQYNVAILLSGLSITARMPGFINLLFCISVVLVNVNLKEIWKEKKLLLSIFIALVPITLFLTYMCYLTGDCLAPLHEQAINWDRKFMIPFINYFSYLSQQYFIIYGGWDNGFISFLIATSVLGVIIIYFINNRKAIIKNKESMLLYLYGILLLVIAFSSSVNLISTIRYAMVCIPFYLCLVALFRKYCYMETFYLLFYTIMNTIITIAYFNNYYFVV